MKNVVMLIAVLALTAPVFAQTVDITCVDNGDGSVTIGYANASEEIAGVSMLVTLSGGDRVLNACGDATTGPASEFGAHIDYWADAGTGSPASNADVTVNTDVGCPVGADIAAGLPAFPATVFAISTGVLEDPPGGAAAGSGEICTLVLAGTTDTTVTLSADIAQRGGVVGTSGTELSASFPTPCTVTDGGAEPACWSFPTQCNGDTDGDGDVDTVDWPVFRDGFGKSDPDPDYLANICADFDHDGDIDTADWPFFRDNFGGVPAANCP